MVRVHSKIVFPVIVGMRVMLGLGLSSPNYYLLTCYSDLLIGSNDKGLSELRLTNLLLRLILS